MSGSWTQDCTDASACSAQPIGTHLYEQYAKRGRDDEDAPELEDRPGAAARSKDLAGESSELARQVAQGIKVAAENGWTRAVRVLLDDPNVDPSVDNNYAFRIAAENGHTAVVQLLLADSRVDPSAESNDALFETLENGHIAIVRLLLADSRIDPAAGQNSAIMIASEKGYADIVRLLLDDSRVDPTIRDNDPIRNAAKNGHTETVKLLLADSRVDPSANDNYAIRWAAEEGHIVVVRLLLDDARVDPSANDNYAIRLAAQNGHIAVVRLLLTDSRVDPSAQDNLAFKIAAQTGRLNIVRLLLDDSRVDPSAEDNFALGVAAANGYINIVQLLLDDSRVDPTGDDNYAIRLAAEEGHTNVVRLLLEDSRVDPAAGQNGAIRYAAANGRTDIVQLLLDDSRVDPSAKDNYAIVVAAEEGYIDIVRLLLDDRRVDPRAQDNLALVTASKQGHADVVELLISWSGPRKEKIQSDKKRVRFALYLAVENDHVNVARILIQWIGTGYYRRITFKEGTVEMMAEKGFDELLKLILDDRRYKGTYLIREVYTMIAKYNRRDLLSDILQDIDNVSKKQFIDLVCLAARFKQEQMVQQLLVPIYVNKLDNVSELDDCFIMAAKEGSLDIVRRLLTVSLSNARRINPATQDNLALYDALQDGHGDVAYFLLQQNQVFMDESFESNKVLVLSVRSGSVDLLDYVLVRFEGQLTWRFLKYAYQSKNPAMVQRLLDVVNPRYEVELDPEPLVESGNVEMARIIFQTEKLVILNISNFVEELLKNNHVELIDYLLTEKILDVQEMFRHKDWLKSENVQLVTKLLDYALRQKKIIDQNGRLARYPMFY